jgi:hypothetical protein
MFAQVQEKALYKVGQKVTCDYFPGVIYKVEKKDRDYNGTLIYTIRSIDGAVRDSGLRQKYLNRV